MASTKNRRIFCIAFSLLILAAIGGLSYFIWYQTYYKYNIADHVHTIKLSQSQFAVKVIWQRKDWQCRAEIYQGTNWQHEIDLGRWFISNEIENGVVLTSGSGPIMVISVHEDLPNVASISFCSNNGYDDCCSYFDLNNLQWNDEYQTRNLPFVSTEMRNTVDRLSDHPCRNSYTTNYYTTEYTTP